MISFIIGIAFIFALFKFGFQISDAILSILIWFCFKLPLAILIGAFGFALCCTIILIPVGISCINKALELLF